MTTVSPSTGHDARGTDGDRHRPRFHFTAPTGWLNDPNGLTQRDGEYHLFYQHNPHGPVHERIHWGHARSTDLVHWHDEPIALSPGEGADADGCWSGVLVDDDGTPTIVYSGRRDGRELACLATGSDDLRQWSTHPGNPVIAETPPGLDLVAFRDHCVWRENGVWRQLVGAGIRDVGGAALLYESTDLRSWRYIGPLLVGDADHTERDAPGWAGTMWECVDLFGLTGDGVDADVLVFSAWDAGTTHHPLAVVGRYAGDTFVPDRLERLDLGGRFFYAPQSMRDERGRRVMFGWMQEGRPDSHTAVDGWSGVMSLPRVVRLDERGRLAQRPAPEVDALRGQLLHDGPVADGPLAGPGGDQLDLELELELEVDGRVEIAVLESPDGPERTVYTVARTASGATFGLDRSASSLDPEVDTAALSGEVPIGHDGRIAMRILVDHSALEAFAGGVALAARAYPVDAAATGVSVTTTRARVVGRVWRMRDALPGRR